LADQTPEDETPDAAAEPEASAPWSGLEPDEAVGPPPEPPEGEPPEPPVEHTVPADVELEPEPGPEPPLVLEPPPAPPPRRPPPPRPAPKPAPRPGRLGRLVRRLVVLMLVVGVVLPLASVLVYRFIPPPVTILMVQRLFEGKGLDRRWVSLKKMSPALPNAVIAAEDARYCSHFGFDFQALEKAMAHNKRRPGRIRGGSTISQQTAKNVFLWPQRSYVRKGLEAYFTVLIETLWGKKRIMEVYLNTVEWGPGVYGADSAARKYFGVGADQLSPAQAARLAAILPSPLKWRAAKPGPYVRKRSQRIGAASGTVRREGLGACVG
jgi:monofunctional biosynthetic peptidoglycan transglycosylase